MMKYHSLGDTGIKLSIIGFGGSGYGNVYGPYDGKAAINGLKYGLDCGINYIDTAPWYGQGASESFLGRALEGIQRSRYFIATKVGRYERKPSLMFNFDAMKVIKSAEESLRRLNLDHVDVLQVHDIEFAPSIEIILNETLPALKTLQNRGLCRYIGITGYPLSILRTAVQNSQIKIDTVLSYCRLTLNDSSLINDFNFYDSNNVGVINASPLSMGLLAPESIQCWHPASDEIKKACFQAVEYCRHKDINISRIALNYSTSFEQVYKSICSIPIDRLLHLVGRALYCII